MFYLYTWKQIFSLEIPPWGLIHTTLMEWATMLDNLAFIQDKEEEKMITHAYVSGLVMVTDNMAARSLQMLPVGKFLEICLK